MLVSNKHFIPVIGLDIHIVILFGFPIPLPHPYIGFVLDPMDYIPFIGATTKVNHMPRGLSDTSGIIIILFHIPMGGPWLLAPLIGHDSVNFFGSKTIKAEGRLLSPTGHMLMTCNDIGIPLSLQPGKKLKPLPSMYLPTSFSIPLSFGKPVMVGGPYVPDWAGVLLNLAMSFGFGALMKGIGKAGRKGVTKFNHTLKGKIGSNKLSNALCKKGFEPVDLVQGIVIYDGTDFELPGPIPLKWDRSWNSDSPHEGLLGHGNHLSYDMRIQEFNSDAAVVVLLGDGRSAVFDALPASGDSDYNRHEKMTLKRTDIDEYQLYDHDSSRYYTFRKTYAGAPQYHLSTIHNKAQFMISFHYNHRGALVRVIDSAGRHLHIKNDSHGRILSVTGHHRGQERLLISYAYNETGDLTDITDALGQTTKITYRDHLMVKKTDRNGQSFYWEYDKQRRCVHTWGDGGLLEGYIEYHPKEGYNLVTNSLGQTTTYYYTPDSVVHQVKDPLGYSTFMEYTPEFEMYREIDEEGNVTGYTYDEAGNCTAIVNPDGSQSSFSYNELGYLNVEVDAQGNSRSYVYYEDNGLLHSLTEPDGSLQLFEYNDRRLLSRIEGVKGDITLLSYDEDCNLTTLTLADGGVSRWEYDAWGYCISVSTPLQQEQVFRYDNLGRVVEVLVPDGNRIQLQYDAYDDIVRATDKQHDIKYTYTPLGSLKTREENNAKVRLLYNTEDELTTVINEHGESFRISRNARGEVIQETGFDGIVKRYERDGSGKIVRMHRPGGRQSEFEYDFNGQLTRIEHNDGSWETFSYDRNGLLTEAVNEHSTIRFVRDSLGRITEEWQNGHRVNSVYDRLGRRKSISSSLGADIAFGRDGIGLLNRIEAVTETKRDPWTAHIQRNLLGLEIERILPGSVKSSRTFDKAGMLASHQVSSGTRTTHNRYYRWDTNAKLKQIINALEHGTTKFGHDDFGNLSWAQYENGQYDYRLPDKTGNLYRTSERKDRQYDAGGQLKETPNARFKYDEEGNLVEKLTKDLALWKYEWYANGMLKKVIRPDRKEVVFEYDALGRRTAKIYQQHITRWIWDGDTPLHEWKYPVSQRPVTIIDDTGNIITQEEPVPAETLITWVFDAESAIPAAKIIGGRSYSIVTDHIGTPCQAYDDTGEIVWSCELDIYGKVRKLAGDRTFIPFRYQGQYEDVETELYYNRYRYYNPDDGVYISQDPIAPMGGFRFYSYVKDPNSWIDLLGLVAGPAGLPDVPGIYILTNGKESYVGCAGLGKQGMRTRISDTRHHSAQYLLEKEGTVVQYVRVDVGHLTDRGDRNNILRYYEQREFDKQSRKKGMTMLNDPDDRIQAEEKKPYAEALIKKHKIRASSRRTTVKPKCN
jgi:RHS repeat-associated protein